MLLPPLDEVGLGKHLEMVVPHVVVSDHQGLATVSTPKGGMQPAMRDASLAPEETYGQPDLCTANTKPSVRDLCAVLPLSTHPKLPSFLVSSEK